METLAPIGEQLQACDQSSMDEEDSLETPNQSSCQPSQPSQHACKTCVSLLHTQLLRRPDANGTPSRSRAQLEEAARTGCTRCRLVLDGINTHFAALGRRLDDFVLIDHIKLRENGNAMGVRLVTSSPEDLDGEKVPQGKTCTVDLVFHVTALRLPPGLDPARTSVADVPVFEEAWLTTKHWDPMHMPIGMAGTLELPIDIPNMASSTEEGDTGRPVFECSDSPQVFECIQDWLKKCTTEHEPCRHLKTQDVALPTRLLDVRVGDGSGGDKSKDTVLLIETHADQRDTYVCLSHCWGAYHTQPLRTLRENLAQHTSAGIECCHLPKTFQDAVTIVRRMGLRYLWIDSLCIVQDDPADWSAEVARMADVYSRAHFTVAALSAQSSQDGCFSSDRSARAHALAMPVSFQGKLATVFVRRDHGHPGGMFMSQNTVLERGLGQPLLERAWVLQERALSSRVVYFGRSEIFWECAAAGYCGCRPGIRRDLARPGQVATEPWRKWQLIVGEYCTLSLTMEMDTFPALAGVATAFQREHHNLGRYLAGHWETHLPRCLGWTANRFRSSDRPWHAPTWSWGSVRSAQYSLEHMDPACSVVAAECTLAGEDQYGELDSCWIELKGRMFPGTVWYDIDDNDPSYVSWHVDMKTTYGHGYFSADLDLETVDSPDAVPPSKAIQLWCFHLGVSKPRDVTKGNKDLFLALRPLDVSPGYTYERVGLVSFNQLHGTIFPDGQLYDQEEVMVRLV